jgi:hypothetical protein
VGRETDTVCLIAGTVTLIIKLSTMARIRQIARQIATMSLSNTAERLGGSNILENEKGLH